MVYVVVVLRGEDVCEPEVPGHVSLMETLFSVTVQEVVSCVPHSTVTVALGRMSVGVTLMAMPPPRVPMGSGGGTQAPDWQA